VERDRIEHPQRPLPSGAADVRAAGRFGTGLLVAGVLLAAAFAGTHAGLAAAAAAAAALWYDVGARRFRILGALALGLARAANAASGALAAEGDLDRLLGDGTPTLATAFPAAVGAYTVLLTWISTFEGRVLRPWASSVAAIALFTSVGMAWALFPRAHWPQAPAIPLVFLAGGLAASARTAAEEGGPGLGALVRTGVFSFLLVDSVWLFGAGRYDAGLWWIVAHVVLRLVLLRARS
jgi:4-hydroxybenzoate polyprenyltransferase